MTTIVTMPQLGESVVEGTVARWLKAPGDTIEKLEPLLEIATDKIDTEIPAPASGTLLDIVAPEGTTVAVGSVLAHIGDPGKGEAQTATTQRAFEAPHQPRQAANIPSTSQSNTDAAEATASGNVRAEKPTGRAFISPVVARIAGEHDVDLADVSGTGHGGRVTKKDILAFIAKREKDDHSTPVAQATSNTTRATQSASSAPALTADETVQPLSTMRQAIAQHMALSKATSPHVTTVFEVDMTQVVRHREANRQPFAEKGIKLTYTPYFVAAVAAALRAVPTANSRFTDAGIVFNRRIHIGVAVALPDGLMVPVIRDADEKNLQGLARVVNDLADQARDGTLAAGATQGGTFTVTNHGVTGSLMGTPIINQPQSSILGIGTITKRAVVRSVGMSLLPSADDALVIRPTCYLSLSFDHRVLDGASADAFLTVVREQLEAW